MRRTARLIAFALVVVGVGCNKQDAEGVGNIATKLKDRGNELLQKEGNGPLLKHLPVPGVHPALSAAPAVETPQKPGTGDPIAP